MVINHRLFLTCTIAGCIDKFSAFPSSIFLSWMCLIGHWSKETLVQGVALTGAFVVVGAAIAGKDVFLRLFVLCCCSLLTHWHSRCQADLPAKGGSNRKQEEAIV